VCRNLLFIEYLQRNAAKSHKFDAASASAAEVKKSYVAPAHTLILWLVEIKIQ
jgi:hypothetical protein